VDSPYPTAPWIVAQAVPSPQIVVHEQKSHFGARWQVTPILYSFGVNRRTAPWRAFVVEPFVRQSGSVELFVSPEFLAVDVRAVDRFSLRVGTRSYFPLVGRGENLSMSIGTSYGTFSGGFVAYEVGLYVLFGFLGLQVAASPTPDAPLIGTLSVRVF
jgi:hypothetical protein